ncbi:MAG: hypothetical protein A3G91_04285 [Omnitrophica WOR_2 bacterium RIFCSPLOWO2_12_FULL_50_9]|nr:MAG: hypothetical protein A3D87_00345 [Omnitrophica WOR_2 bacterium RIFCSPHIGHO2_02_FULL_50_17]OGX41136.1 MAG: hypothetical protein A3G91_04285 [Omnitrophica WOR_2 bacterium RIFCSPLOWO2_12_FULL_50_9]
MIARAMKNIVIAEDDSSIAETMAKSLKKLEFNILAVVSTGESAMEKTRELKPDLVIMDVVLEGDIDGIEAGQHIEKELSIPVIYITGFRDKAVLLEEQGKVPLVKPFQINDLTVAIGTVFYQISDKEKRKGQGVTSKISDLLN